MPSVVSQQYKVLDIISNSETCSKCYINNVTIFLYIMNRCKKTDLISVKKHIPLVNKTSFHLNMYKNIENNCFSFVKILDALFPTSILNINFNIYILIQSSGSESFRSTLLHYFTYNEQFSFCKTIQFV